MPYPIANTHRQRVCSAHQLRQIAHVSSIAHRSVSAEMGRIPRPALTRRTSRARALSRRPHLHTTLVRRPASLRRRAAHLRIGCACVAAHQRELACHPIRRRRLCSVEKCSASRVRQPRDRRKRCNGIVSSRRPAHRQQPQAAGPTRCFVRSALSGRDAPMRHSCATAMSGPERFPALWWRFLESSETTCLQVRSPNLNLAASASNPGSGTCQTPPLWGFWRLRGAGSSSGPRSVER